MIGLDLMKTKVSGIGISNDLESEVIGKVKSYELFDRNKKLAKIQRS